MLLLRILLLGKTTPTPRKQLWDEVLEDETVLLEGAEGSQVTGSKYKEIAARDEEEQ